MNIDWDRLCNEKLQEILGRAAFPKSHPIFLSTTLPDSQSVQSSKENSQEHCAIQNIGGPKTLKASMFTAGQPTPPNVPPPQK